MCILGIKILVFWAMMVAAPTSETLVLSYTYYEGRTESHEQQFLVK